MFIDGWKIIVAVVAVWFGVDAGLADVPVLQLPMLSEQPVIDGRIDDAVWNEALTIGPFVSVDGRELLPATTARMAVDDSGLWIAIRGDEPNPTEIRQNIQRRNGRVWLDDAIELFLDLNHDKRTYHHLVINTTGVVFAQRAASPPDPDKVGPWSPWVNAQTYIGDDHWTMELYLPFASLGDLSSVGDTIGMNICRGRMAGGQEQFSCAVPTYGSFHEPAAFAAASGLSQALAGHAGHTGHGDKGRVEDLAQLDVHGAVEIEAARDGDQVLLSFDHADMMKRSGLTWFVILEDAAGRMLDRRSFDVGSSQLDDVSSDVRSLRWLAQDDRGRPIVVTPPVMIRAYQAVSLSLYQPYYDVEESLEANYRINNTWRGKALTGHWAIRDSAGQVCEQREFEVAKISGRVTPSIASLVPGTYELSLVLRDKRGHETMDRATFTKRPAPEHLTHVAHNDQGMIEVDGEPFFPIGLYRLTPPLWGHWLRDSGFNTVHDMGVGAGRFRRNDDGSITWTTTLKQIEADLDRAHKLGLKVLFELGVYVKHTYEVEPGEEDGRRLREVVSRFRRHPALLGYYLIDEPYAQHFERAKRAYEIVRRLDPYHPQIAPSLGRSFYYKPTAQLVDALLISCYPVPYRPIAAVGESLDTARKLVGLSKPLWFVPQAVGLRGDGSLPTAEELTNMTYQAMGRGVGGLIYFAWFGDQPRQTGELGVKAPEFWEALVGLTRQLQQYRHVFYAAPDATVTLKSDAGLELFARQSDGKQYLLAINPRRRHAELRIASAAKEEPWQVMVGHAESSTDSRFALAAGEVLLLSRSNVGRYQATVNFTDDAIPDQRNVLANGSFESGTNGWSIQGNAGRSKRDPYTGESCVSVTSPTGTARVVSDAIEVEPGQRLFCVFHVRVDGAASGRTVDAVAEAYDKSGRLLATLPLTGPDERVATDMAWQWIGKAVEMPPSAATMRVSLGTANNRGVTSYDGVSVIDERQLTQQPNVQAEVSNGL